MTDLVSGRETLEEGHHALLGHEAGDEGGGDAPVRKAQRGEQRGDIARDARQNAGLRVGGQRQAQVKVLQKPDDDGGGKDDRKGLLQEVPGFFPQQLRHVFQAGQAVVGQLHDERDGLALEHRALEQQCRQPITRVFWTLWPLPVM